MTDESKAATVLKGARALVGEETHTPHWGAGGGAHNNTPPALVLNYIIKT